MMILPYISIVLFFLIPISFFIGKRYYKKSIQEFMKKGNGKFGIIIYREYNSPCHVIEIEELESAGNYIKVRVLNVCSNYNKSESPSKVLLNNEFNEWVKKDTIIWYDDNSQRSRDEKLKEILGS